MTDLLYDCQKNKLTVDHKPQRCCSNVTKTKESDLHSWFRLRVWNKLIQRALLRKIWMLSFRKPFEKTSYPTLTNSPGRNSHCRNVWTHWSRYNAIAGSGWCCQSHYRGVGGIWQVVSLRAALWLHLRDGSPINARYTSKVNTLSWNDSRGFYKWKDSCDRC